MNIIDALVDQRMLGGVPAFSDLSTWKRWCVFLVALYGLPFSTLCQVGISEDEALVIFRQHTGRGTYAPPPGGYAEAAAIVGRQAAKTRVGATIADFEAIKAQPEPDSTETYCALVAQDQRNALRALFSYSAAPFDTVPTLSRMVPSGWRALWRKARRADSLTLENGVRIAVYPCSPSALRGIRARVVILDELAFYRASDGNPVDVEMLRACRPCLATTGGKLIVLSSPYAQTGALYDLHRRHFGRDDSSTLVWVASAPEMNPLLSADYLRRMAEDDPEAYRSEVLGEFRQGITTFLDPDAIEACIDVGVRERPWVSGIDYRAGYDASGGRDDASALAIAHAIGNDSGALDVLRAWPGGHNPAHAIREACDVLKRYRISVVSGDSYAAGFVENEFREHGIRYQAVEIGEQKADRSKLYHELRPLVNTARVRLIDDADLLRELRSLERTRGATRDRVNHRPGGHDDRAVASTIALVGAVAGLQTGGPPVAATLALGNASVGPLAGIAAKAYGEAPAADQARNDFDFCGSRGSSGRRGDYDFFGD